MKTILLLISILATTVAYTQTFDELKATFTEQFQDKDYAAAAKTADKMAIKAKTDFGEKHINYAIAFFYGGEASFYLQDFKKAISCYNRSIGIIVAIYKTDEIEDIAIMQNSIGAIYYATERYDSAIYYYKPAVEYYLTHDNTVYKTVYTVCNNLIEACKETGDHETIIAVADKLIPVILAQSPADNEHYYTTLMAKGQSLFITKKYALAETVFMETLFMSEKLNGKASTDYSANQVLLFRCARYQSKNAEAEEYLENALRYGLLSNPVDTGWILDIYTEGGVFYTETASFDKSESYFNKGAEWCKQTGLDTHKAYFNLLYQQAGMLIQKGDEMASKTLLLHILDLNNRYDPSNELMVGQVYATLSNAEMQLGEFSALEKHAKNAISILHRLKPEGTLEESTAYQALGMLYNRLSRLDNSVEAFTKAIEISISVFGDDNKLESIIYSNLGNAYMEHAEFAKAEPNYIRAIQINYKLYGEKHPFYATSVANLGVLYIQQGRFKEADQFLAEAITIYQQNNMMATANARMIVNSLAYMHLIIGDFTTAKALYNDLLNEIDETNPNNIDILSYVYHNMTMIFEAEKKIDSIIYYENKVMKLLSDNNRMHTDIYLKAGNSLIRAYAFSNQLEKGSQLGETLLPLAKEVMGEKSSTYSKILSNIAWLEKKKGDIDKAARLINQSGQIMLDNFRKNFYILSEKEKLSWWSMGTSDFDVFPLILQQLNITNGRYAGDLMNQRLQIKGFVLQDAAGTLRRLRENGSEEIKTLIDEWEAAKSIAAKLYAIPVKERSLDIDSLENEITLLEKRINSKGSAELITSDEPITWQQVRNKLNNNEAAIEFYSFRCTENDYVKDSVIYAAFILRKSLEYPQIVYLSNEKKIAGFLSSEGASSKQEVISRLYRASVKSKAATEFLGDSLYNLLWKPLMPYLSGINKIVFSPDGILHKIAFQALPLDRTTFLIDSFQLQQYSSVKQILDNSNENTTKWNSALLLGNPDFNNTVYRGKPISFSGNGEWPSLAGTAQEIAAIQTLMNTKGVNTKTLTTTNANEENLKKIKPVFPEIIHLSTHGFFLKDSVQENFSSAGLSETQTVSTQLNPLLRSGIILAGANKAWSKEKLPDGAEDGILNAYEISQLNLSKTKLVVLSACETALGEVQTNEGVFGLQRAFKMAGARNLIVSLWQVPDKETAELMTLFYGYLLNKNTVREAFYKAQKDMRKKYPPYSWAAFILIE